MDIFLRSIAIVIEVGLLVAITYAVLKGVRLTIFDLGVGPKYNKALTMAFVVIGVILSVFFIAHLTTFYPTVRI